MKNLYCAYYTNSEAITKYMTRMLHLEDGDRVLEPSAGEGIFVESVLGEHKQVQIDALDIDSKAIEILKMKFEKNDRVVSIRETDTLFDSQLDFYYMYHGYYDKVIGNPPYGAWQDLNKRKELKQKYCGYYVKETYSLFLLRSLSVLKNGGRLAFIIPDTFLFLNMHENLRKTLLKNTQIIEILIFPSKFFPGISFGYSNLSIITLKKNDDERCALNNVMRIVRGFKDVKELPFVLDNDFAEGIQIDMVKQFEVLENANSRLLLKDAGLDLNIYNMKTTLGDFADVVTGFYCGNNTRFIKARDKTVKGSKNYEVVKFDEVVECCSLKGITEVGKKYIPYVKSSPPKRYLRESDDWYVMWDEETVQYYNSNKKSRFQNSNYYFRTGIAIPMVKSRVLKATLIENRVFDQSIVGIFPKETKYLYYMLAFMNSDIVCKMIHIINPTTNNSSNYVKQIPFIRPSEKELENINSLVERIINTFGDEAIVHDAQAQINEYFDKKYSEL